MVTLTNTGTAVLNIAGISNTGANASDFTKTNDCVASMAVNAVCTFNVKLTPAAAGARSASIMVDDDAPGNPHSIALMGTGQVQPTATLSANTLTFAATVSGMSSASQMVTVTNNGGTALAITSIALGGTNLGDFTETTTCGSSLAASGNCTISPSEAITCVSARPLLFASSVVFDCSEQATRRFFQMDARCAVRNGSGCRDSSRGVRVGWLR